MGNACSTGEQDTAIRGASTSLPRHRTSGLDLTPTATVETVRRNSKLLDREQMIRLISPSKRHNEADAWLDYESMDAPRDLPDDIDLESLGPLEYIGNGAHCCAYACTYEGRPAVVKIPADQSNNDINLGYLYKELWVLQRIDHPNVIKLLGSGTSPCLFLVLERLHCTLDVKLGTNAPYESTLVGAYKRRKVRQKFTDEDACVYASKLALVLGYLHNEAMENHAIMHRDLKPSNVGIDAEGNLKLFDFGLATLAPRSELYKDTYLMTGKTGSARYMAPEVRAAQHYDTSADVFSWSLIASEMLLLRRPFDEYDYKTFMRRPSAADERPQLPKDCLPELAEAITEAWDKDASKRPSLVKVAARLEEACRNASFSDTASSGMGSIASSIRSSKRLSKI